jgi:hypothetical protein
MFAGRATKRQEPASSKHFAPVAQCHPTLLTRLFFSADSWDASFCAEYNVSIEFNLFQRHKRPPAALQETHTRDYGSRPAGVGAVSVWIFSNPAPYSPPPTLPETPTRDHSSEAAVMSGILFFFF